MPTPDFDGMAREVAHVEYHCGRAQGQHAVVGWVAPVATASSGARVSSGGDQDRQGESMSVRPGDAGYVTDWDRHHAEAVCGPPAGVTRVVLRELAGYSSHGTYGEAAFIRPHVSGGFTFEIVNSFNRVLSDTGDIYPTAGAALDAARRVRT